MSKTVEVLCKKKKKHLFIERQVVFEPKDLTRASAAAAAAADTKQLWWNMKVCCAKEAFKCHSHLVCVWASDSFGQIEEKLSESKLSCWQLHRATHLKLNANMHACLYTCSRCRDVLKHPRSSAWLLISGKKKIQNLGGMCHSYWLATTVASRSGC